MTGPGKVGTITRGETIFFIPVCQSHQPTSFGSPSRSEELAKTNATVHNTDMHPKIEEPTLFEVAA
jgi:hypothetical protein